MEHSIGRMCVDSLPELMDKMYGDRVVFKKKMLAAKQEYEKTPTKALGKGDC